MSISINDNHHKLFDKWTLWAHLPHDTCWNKSSYIKIFDFETVEAAIILSESLPDKMICNCMLFLMRFGINPMWEDPKNRDGGCFSYKVSNKIVQNSWREISYKLVGETITPNELFQKSINGISISPKKNFCVIKVWMANCNNQDSNIIGEVAQGITNQGCIFKKHNSQ